MNPELLEIQPQELRFIFESKKQSSCSIRLANKSDHHVAFKVKTTSSRKYCVRPNTGVIKPNLTCDFTVTRQAQNVAPPGFICKDKFLVQCTIVPKGTKEEHITSTTFAKEDGKRIEEKKLKVILVSPPHSPVLSPMKGISRMRPYNAATESKDDLVQKNSSHAKVDEDIEVSRRDGELVETTKNEQFIKRKHTEELRLTNDVEDMKSKLIELESILRQDKLRTKRNTKARVQIGFQLLVVFVVALTSLYLGYLLHR